MWNLNVERYARSQLALALDGAAHAVSDQIMNQVRAQAHAMRVVGGVERMENRGLKKLCKIDQKGGTLTDN
ncbi:MAG: hypothetical protein A2496_23360 [Burkholderiales bacterium RIFOXYC12_FULL_60_6]|nr:MAG: hypothetical protein A2496_23360 [Burkholderiales bacterium RIFOXYC12_FULL_60_6]